MIAHTSNEKLITFNNIPVTAVIDTGSNHNLITTNLSDEFGCEVVEERMDIVGLGEATVTTGGAVTISSVIDDHQYDIRYHILSEKAIPGADCVLGMEFLTTVDFSSRGEGINIRPRDEKHPVLLEDTTTEISRMLHIDVSLSEEEIIAPAAYKKLIEELTNRFAPAASSPTTMIIKLTDETPMSQKPRRLALQEQQVVDEQIREWLKDGIIEESRSAFAYPTVVVPKKDVRHRVTVDYRRLNEKIIRDHYPLPLHRGST